MSALADGSAIAAKGHCVSALGRQTALVSWECEEAPDLSNLSIEDVRTYLFFLEHSHFSLVGQDGAIVQMSFRIHRGDIVYHRLCYIPCPVVFDPLELLEDNLYDIVARNLHSQNYDLIRQRGVVRFDYDPNAVADNHPSCHLTLNFDKVRVPVSRNFDAATFLEFVDANFLASRVDMRRFKLVMAHDETADVLHDRDRGKPHLGWLAA